MTALPRRRFLATGLGAFSAGTISPALAAGNSSAPRVKLTRLELIPVRATERTVWLFVRLHTDAGLTGLGEASDAFGFLNTTRAEAARMTDQLNAFLAPMVGRSPLDIAWFRPQQSPNLRHRA